jgi:peptide/nickel transport system substrate-binding protein
MKKFGILIVGIFLIISLVTAEPAQPLRFVTSFTIKSLNPVSQGFWMAEYGVAELLMQYRSDGQHYPWLLKSLRRTDDLTWVLTIRENLTFQNGKPVDETAVLAVMQRQMKLSSSAQSRIPEGTTFEITGPLEITLKTPQPYPGLIAALADEAVFPVYDTEAVEAVGEDYEKLAGAGFYTGPYSIVSLDEQALILERNDAYWAGLPALPGVEVRFVSDAQARILAVQNGEADIVNYPPTEAKQVVDATPGIHFVYGQPSSGGFRVVLNTQNAPMESLEVRKALIRSIDYAVIAQNVMDDVVLQAKGFYPEWAPFAVENQYTDQEEARQILEKAGWQAGKDRIRSKDGQRLSVVLLIYPQQPDLVPISEAMQAQLREVGFEVEIQSVESINDTLNGATTPWDIAMISSGAISFGGSPDSPLRMYNHSEGSRNYAKHSNPELDALIEELCVTVAEERRLELLHQIQDILIEKDPQQFFIEFHTNRHIVNDTYEEYQPGMALYFVHYLTRPGQYDMPAFPVE